MKQFLVITILILFSYPMYSQTFNRSELSTTVTRPWEILYGPDDFLWVTELGGKVSRIDPNNGNKIEVYTAPDYFGGSPLENSPLCPNLKIGAGTLGLALHPDFLNPINAFIYFVYSYNSGSNALPTTKFRIKRLKWDALNESVVDDTNIVNLITTGYDHLGGRLLAVEQDNVPYLFLSIGDNGRSDEGSDICYSPLSSNPNNFTQDITTQNGKIHRFNMDGTIPSDNPVQNNSFYTRGHRNPQGLMYNPNLDILYDIEHGDKTDDEINVLHKGMNYGWKNVRGYHGDNSFSGEGNFVANYTAHPQIVNDALIEPLYSWCTTPADSGSSWTEWCTVAPSGGIYYGNSAIPEWTNSLLVVTLKDGVTTDKEVYQFKLQANGELEPSTTSNPNPKKYFGQDQSLNGRLRDIAVSNDGKSIYLINNGGTSADKITVYNYDYLTSITENNSKLIDVKILPNPATEMVKLHGLEKYPQLREIRISNVLGISHKIQFDQDFKVDISELANGIHFINLVFEHNTFSLKFIKQ